MGVRLPPCLPDFYYEVMMNRNNRLTIIRGLPGSGKSTLAKKILAGYCQEGKSTCSVHHENDMYWIRPDGSYDFNNEKIKDAQKWCFDNVKNDLWCNNNVIVSNVFSTHNSFQKYVDTAIELGVEYEIITCRGDYGDIHEVPEEFVKYLSDQWED